MLAGGIHLQNELSTGLFDPVFEPRLEKMFMIRARVFLGLICSLAVVGATLHAADEPALPAEPRFSRHLVPLFSRLGCNAGACHGAVKGQNGFRLTLFGSPISYGRTLYHVLGIDPDKELFTANGRPVRIISEDAPLIRELV